MLRLALVTESDKWADRVRRDLAAACARLRGVELVTISGAWQQLDQAGLDRIDAVVFHGHVAERLELVCLCAEARKHVLVNDGFSESIESVDHVIRVCRAANVRLMAGGTLRFQPSLQTIKAALDTGRLGVPALLRSHCWQASEGGSPDRQRQLCQQLDLASWIFKTFPTEIYALQHAGQSGTMQIHLGYPDGGMALITICDSLPPGDRYRSCTVIGSQGAAYSDDHRQMQLIYRDNGLIARRTTEGVAAQVEELSEFIQAIEQNRDPQVSGSELRQSLLLTDAVMRSIASRQPLRGEGGGYVAVH